MVVQRQIRIAVGNSWRVEAEELFLDDQTFGLELDCLEKVPKPVLDIGHFGYACGDVLIHWSTDLEENVDCLAVVVQCLFKLVLSKCGFCLGHHLICVFIIDIQFFQDRVKVSNIGKLKRQITIGKKLLIRQNLIGLSSLRSLLLRFGLFLALIPLTQNIGAQLMSEQICIILQNKFSFFILVLGEIQS